MADLPPPPRRQPRGAATLVWDDKTDGWVCTIARYKGRDVTPPAIGRGAEIWNAVLNARCVVDDMFDEKGWER